MNRDNPSPLSFKEGVESLKAKEFGGFGVFQ
jgi:hypothetical protein